MTSDDDQFSVTDAPEEIREADVPPLVEELDVEVDQREYGWDELPDDLRRKIAADQEHDLERQGDEEERRSREREQAAEETANPDAHRDEPPFRS